MLRILHIIPNLRKGGAERLLLNICNELNTRNDIQVKLIVFRTNNSYSFLTEQLDWTIIPSVVRPSISSKWEVHVTALQRAIENFQPDIIHSHLFETEIVLSQINYPNAKYVVHFHDNMIQFENWKWRNIFEKVKLTNYYEKGIVEAGYRKRKTAFIAISKDTQHYLKRVLPIASVTLLHNAINVKRFQKPEKHINVEEQSTRKILNSQFSILNLVNIGSFVPKKNQIFLLDIIVELNKRGQRVNCFFLGDGPIKAEVEDRAKELAILDQCQFLGNVENVEEYLWNSNIYVHSATYEPLGLVLLEAMAAGLPVVTLDGRGNRDLMENGKNGFILTEKNPKHFAEKILEVKNNEEMKKYNVKFAQKFDIVNYTNKLLEFYQTVLKEKTLPTAADNH
jgi:glycosyltransferase involved in cell wall biosynthesis